MDSSLRQSRDRDRGRVVARCCICT